MVYALRTHRSFENPLLETVIDEKTHDVLAQQRKGVWYKRLWFYFFEQEITTDVRERIAKELKQGSQHLLDPECQSLVTRCVAKKQYQYVSADELTFVVNNYLFSQGEFVQMDYQQADEVKATYMSEYMQSIAQSDIIVSDALLQLRRLRADVTIASQLSE